MRHAAKRDGNEPEIVEALEHLGVYVLRVSSPGAPDLLCYRDDRGWLPIEIKQPGETLTPAQLALRARACFPVVRSVEEALKLYGVEA